MPRPKSLEAAPEWAHRTFTTSQLLFLPSLVQVAEPPGAFLKVATWCVVATAAEAHLVWTSDDPIALLEERQWQIRYLAEQSNN